MRRRHLKLKVALAVSVVAMLVLPGEAKPVAVQTAFGPLADPHLSSALTVALPEGFWSL